MIFKSRGCKTGEVVVLSAESGVGKSMYSKVLSDEAYQQVAIIYEETERRVIETVAKDLCGKRVATPVDFVDNRRVTKFDENGPYIIQCIINYNFEADLPIVDLEDEDGNTIESGVTISNFQNYDAITGKKKLKEYETEVDTIYK